MKKIGILGGSFNPAHEAHRAISLYAMQQLALDEIWWLIANQNPLKEISGMAPFAKRLEKAREISNHPQILTQDLEQKWGTQYSIDTLYKLREDFPHKFIWLMGADNLAQFHRWKDWQKIAALVPIAVIARPGSEDCLNAPAAQEMAQNRLMGAAIKGLADAVPPAWAYLDGLSLNQSASAIRVQKHHPWWQES